MYFQHAVIHLLKIEEERLFSTVRIRNITDLGVIVQFFLFFYI